MKKMGSSNDLLSEVSVGNSEGVLCFPSANTALLWNRQEIPLFELLKVEQPQLWVVEKKVYRAHTSLFPTDSLQLLPGGEAHKHWKDLEALLALFLEQGLERNLPVLAVGGGAHLDLVAFAASIYGRGTPYIAVPSTLLAMVDAAVGGKNGINFAGHKNLIGTITQPKGLLFDVRFLESLSDEAWSEGFAEVIKYACIVDADLFTALAASHWRAYKNNKIRLENLITRCVQHKARCVAADEEDRQNQRMLLNFGHSLAHALEQSYGHSHGKAVAAGMAFAAWLSVKQGLLPKQKYDQLAALLVQYDLPVYLDFDVELLLKALQRDKKRHEGRLQEICLQDFGKPCIINLSFASLRQQLLCYQNQQ